MSVFSRVANFAQAAVVAAIPFASVKAEGTGPAESTALNACIIRTLEANEPLTLVNAYATFNGGRQWSTYFRAEFERIRDGQTYVAGTTVTVAPYSGHTSLTVASFDRSANVMIMADTDRREISLNAELHDLNPEGNAALVSDARQKVMSVLAGLSRCSF